MAMIKTQRSRESKDRRGKPHLRNSAKPLENRAKGASTSSYRGGTLNGVCFHKANGRSEDSMDHLGELSTERALASRLAGSIGGVRSKTASPPNRDLRHNSERLQQGLNCLTSIFLSQSIKQTRREESKSPWSNAKRGPLEALSLITGPGVLQQSTVLMAGLPKTVTKVIHTHLFLKLLMTFYASTLFKEEMLHLSD
ncbi:hypothetical protein P7K49_006977 [Saguinus oedipus]|uniref:Uncharacterized protein n=1 Tax=Saguinus oedipus TaxID=9490 RepID=A0ABQ9W409_SAGOE|nr:hypothetical protein P7K49_006977 [Saguinus oedipus]